jgi:hypothetical protein
MMKRCCAWQPRRKIMFKYRWFFLADNPLVKPPASVRYRVDVRERFIPVSSHEICEDLSAQARDPQAFAIFCRGFLNDTHNRLHTRMEKLKALYQPFNPDADTVSARVYSSAERAQLSADFFAEMTAMLNDANFELLSEEAINQSMTKISPHGIQASVDFAEFDHIAIYYRGCAFENTYLRDWRKLGLRMKSIDIPVYRRLFLVVKLKQPATRVEELIAQGMSQRKAEARVRNSWRKLPEDIRADAIYLKMFKDMPDSDLEMLFPTVRIHLKLIDKIKLAITGGGGTLGGIFATVTKLSVALNPFAIATAVFGLAGVITRQVTKLFHERTKYMMTLAQHLYFHNLSNNQSALAYLLDLAAEEENKEALLAYYFLLHALQPLSQEALDHEVEAYLQQRYGVGVDFEVHDGLRKLAEAGLLCENSVDQTLHVKKNSVAHNC